MKVFKKSLAAAMAVTVVFSNFCSGGDKPLIGNISTVNAVTNSDDNMDYDNCLSYQGVYNYTNQKIDHISITKCDQSASIVKIPSEIGGLPVTSIGESAFYGCTDLKSVEIPDSVTEIGWNAFSNCTSLKSIEMPDSITSIGTGAFLGCTGLSSVRLPKKLTAVVDFTFQNCTGLKSVEISNSVTSISSAAFENCINLTSIKIPNSVNFIIQNAFFGCTDLTSITIENPKCEIDDNANTICNGIDENKKAYFNGTIYSYDNSTAQVYAEKNGYKFESLGKRPPVSLRGDISRNGEIDLQDAIQIARYILGVIKFTDEEMNIADYNDDYYVDIQDVIGIARYILETAK